MLRAATPENTGSAAASLGCTPNFSRSDREIEGFVTPGSLHPSRVLRPDLADGRRQPRGLGPERGNGDDPDGLDGSSTTH